MNNLIRLLLESNKRYNLDKSIVITSVRDMCNAFEPKIVAEIFYSLYRDENPLICPEEVFEIAQSIIDEAKAEKGRENE